MHQGHHQGVGVLGGSAAAAPHQQHTEWGEPDQQPPSPGPHCSPTPSIMRDNTNSCILQLPSKYYANNFSESVQSNLCVLQSKPVSIDRSHFFVKKFLTRFLLAYWYAAGKYTRPFSRKDGKTALGRDSTLLLRAPTGLKQSEHEIRNQQKQLPPPRRVSTSGER